MFNMKLAVCFPMCGREDSNLHGINSHQSLKLAWLPLQHCRIMSASYPFRSPLISVGQTEHLPSMLRVGFEPTVANDDAYAGYSPEPGLCEYPTSLPIRTTSAFETVYFTWHLNQSDLSMNFYINIQKLCQSSKKSPYIFLSRSLDSNQGPAGHESAALPLSYHAISSHSFPLKTEATLSFSLLRSSSISRMTS